MSLKTNTSNLEQILNNTSSLKTCNVKLIINQPAIGAGWWYLDDNKIPVYDSFIIPTSLDESIWESLGGSLTLNNVIVGSTFWVGEGSYTSDYSEVVLQGECEFASGYETYSPAYRVGRNIIINGDCTITYKG